MSAPDFLSVMSVAADRAPWLLDRPFSESISEAQLAARVPELCQECAGLASPDAAPGMVLGSCNHDHAPTIAHLLAIGAAAWMAIAERDAAYARRANGDVANIHAIDAINAAVKAVRP